MLGGQLRLMGAELVLVGRKLVGGDHRARLDDYHSARYQQHLLRCQRKIGKKLDALLILPYSL